MISFEFDKVKFKSDPQTDSRIAEFKAWLDKYPCSMALVTGHTDLVGTPDYNQALAMKRALVIQRFLVVQGIGEGKMVTESKGETQPVDDYITSDERAKNRRTEISIKMK